MAKGLPDFKQSKVLVVGDVILDQYWEGDSHRISPEAPIPIMQFHQSSWRLGGAANVAMNVHALGADVKLLGITGQDHYAEHLTRLLEHHQLRALLKRLPAISTVMKLRIIAAKQQLLRVDFEKPFVLEKNDEADFQKDYEEALSRVDVVILSDYLKGTLSNVRPFIEKARLANKIVIVDPKSKDFSCYAGATILTPNLKEFETVYGKSATRDELYEKATNACKALELTGMMITEGENGLSLIQAGSVPFHIEAHQNEVIDVTGAGDTVISVFSTALAAGESILASCMIANTAAGIVVKKQGTSYVSYQELYYKWQGLFDSNQIILDESNLLKNVEIARADGKKIVMTNGCFDLLHPGHIHYLRQAKALGDYLIVAVNSDESVKKNKGPERPINSLIKRCHQLTNLRCVDWVVPFHEDTPIELIKKIKPDILVKGGDYNSSEIVGGEYVKSHGGEIKILDYIEGISTTNLIEMIESKKTIKTSFTVENDESEPK